MPARPPPRLAARGGRRLLRGACGRRLVRWRHGSICWPATATCWSGCIRATARWSAPGSRATRSAPPGGAWTCCAGGRAAADSGRAGDACRRRRRGPGGGRARPRAAGRRRAPGGDPARRRRGGAGRRRHAQPALPAAGGVGRAAAAAAGGPGRSGWNCTTRWATRRTSCRWPGGSGVPHEVFVHDYASFCARIALVPEHSYCGEPPVSGCEACVADHGSNLEEAIARRRWSPAPPPCWPPPAAWWPRGGRRDAAAAAFPGRPAGGDAVGGRRGDPAAAAHPAPDPPCVRGRRHRRRERVRGVAGLRAGRGGARLPLRFTVVGFTADDERLLAAGPVFITGQYDEAEVVPLIRAQGADIALLPSVWPETWCFTLGQAWRAGLRAAVFDLGAPAERVRRTAGATCCRSGCRRRAEQLAAAGQVRCRVPAATAGWRIKPIAIAAKSCHLTTIQHSRRAPACPKPPHPPRNSSRS